MNFSRRDFLKTTGAACAAVALPAWVEEAEAAEAAAVHRNHLAGLALDHAKKLGDEYADIRVNRYRNESIFTREQQVQNISRSQTFGFGIRVLFKGAWGFAASPRMTEASVRHITEQAMEI